MTSPRTSLFVSTESQTTSNFHEPSLSTTSSPYVTPREAHPIIVPKYENNNNNNNSIKYKTELVISHNNHDNSKQPILSIEEQKIKAYFRAIRHGRTKIVEEFLLDEMPIDQIDAFGNTMLLVACQNNNKKLAKLALRQGANINHVNNHGKRAVDYAYDFGYKELGNYLVSKGAEP